VSKWLVARNASFAAKLVSGGVTAVAGATALYSAAFPDVSAGESRVLLRWTPKRGQNFIDALDTLSFTAARSDIPRAVSAAAAAAATSAVRDRATMGGWLALRKAGLDVLAPLVVCRAEILTLTDRGEPIAVPIERYLNEGSRALVTGIRFPESKDRSSYRRHGAISDRGPLRVGLAGIMENGPKLRFAVAGIACPPSVVAITRFVGSVPSPNWVNEVLRLLAPPRPLERRVEALLKQVLNELL
jgi:CO/xanthine dehydrogenase FAD-binding subunit